MSCISGSWLILIFLMLNRLLLPRKNLFPHWGEAFSWTIHCVRRNILAYRSDEMDDTAIWLNDPISPPNSDHCLQNDRESDAQNDLVDQVAASKMICAQTTRSLEGLIHEFEASFSYDDICIRCRGCQGPKSLVSFQKEAPEWFWPWKKIRKNTKCCKWR